MKIKTITCHNVYNYGASLQAYALMKYLQRIGCEVEIVDYLPEYLKFSLWNIGPRWNKNLLVKLLFYFYVVPIRIKQKKSREKFDVFTRKYLNLTSKYSTFQELKEHPPVADVYFAGSDQIWNTNINNGLDPAFYLDFIPRNSIRASYAASFSVSQVPMQYRDFVKSMLLKFEYISVREKTALDILSDMGIKTGINVVDPVFLLDVDQWRIFVSKPLYHNYILVYDQENSSLIRKIACYLSKKNNKKIIAFKDLYPRFYADYQVKDAGPIDFINLIAHADIIITNSFHCSAFSMIFEREFCVIPRTHQKVNSRMADLLKMVDCTDHLINTLGDLDRMRPINYDKVKQDISLAKNISYQYISNVLKNIK